MNKLLVCGGASNLLDDLAKINLDEYDIMVINDAGLTISNDILCWATLHPQQLFREPVDWIMKRSKLGWNLDFQTASTYNPNGFKVDIEFNQGHEYGTSTLFGVRVGLFVYGYNDITVAGAPLDSSYGHLVFDNWERKSMNKFRKTWLKARDSYFKDRVKSLSGWTKALLEYKLNGDR